MNIKFIHFSAAASLQVIFAGLVPKIIEWKLPQSCKWMYYNISMMSELKML